jgi:hypothetical protein
MLGRQRQRLTLGLVATALMAVAGWASPAQAQLIFDPLGTGNPAAPSLGTIDLSVGNSLGFNSIPLVPGTQFTTYFQARVAEFTDPNDVPLTRDGREFTVVLALREVVETIAGTTVTFRSLASPVNFLELYADPSNDANDLQGTGFNNGTLILTATPTGGDQGSFTVDPLAGIQNFDQRNANDYPATSTVVGGGRTDFVAQVNTVNAAYFPNGITPFISLGLDFTSENTTPYSKVNPSYRFVSTAGGVSPDLYNVNYVAGGTIPFTLGPVNGGTPPTPRPANLSFQFQTDGSISFAPLAVPEPGTISLAMTGTGLLSLSALRTRRRRNASATA